VLKIQVKFSQNKNLTPIFLGLTSVVELLLVAAVSDLPTRLSGWVYKTSEILNLSMPSDNLYGPGAAILLIPFLWSGPTFFAANIFYVFIGTYYYSKICQKIYISKYRYIAYLSLLLNPYFFWLCHSSYDTVFEFALLMASLYFIMNNKFFLFCIVTFILSETRSQYWVFFLITSIVKITVNLRKKTKVNKLFFLPFLLLLATMGINQSNYDSPSITLWAGETFELGQSKFFYLAHPKFDADVMLGLASDPISYRNTRAPEDFTPAQKNDFYTKQAILTIKENPKQAILNLMQKIDSFIFISQKIPNSPGEFRLNTKGDRIDIIDERLSWGLVLGYLLYQFWRGSMLILFISALAILFYKYKTDRFQVQSENFWLLLPWISTFFVIMLVYMETRYKIIPELLLPVFSLLIISRLSKRNSVSG